MLIMYTIVFKVVSMYGWGWGGRTSVSSESWLRPCMGLHSVALCDSTAAGNNGCKAGSTICFCHSVTLHILFMNFFLILISLFLRILNPPPPTDGWKCQSNCAHQCESDCRTSGDGTDCDLDKVNMNGGHIMLCPVMSRIVFQMSACDQAIVVGFGEAARLKTPYLSCKY